MVARALESSDACFQATLPMTGATLRRVSCARTANGPGNPEPHQTLSKHSRRVPADAPRMHILHFVADTRLRGK